MENTVAAPSGYKPYPWLVFVGGEKLGNQVFCDVISDSKTTRFTRQIPESITNRSVSMPTNISGWLLLKLDVTESESSNQWCLWNAVTLQSINLPVIEESESKKYCIDYVLLTKSPDDCDCAILLWMENPIGILYCYVHEDDGWTFRDYREELMDFKGARNKNDDRFLHPVVYDDDKIFMVACSDVMAKIEIMKPKRLVIRHDRSFWRWSFSHVAGPWYKIRVDWVACRGDLFQINVIFGGLGYNQIMAILVSKLDFSDKSWKKVDSYPNAAFFIMGQQCLGCPIVSADSNKVGNRVYIVDDVHEGRLLLYTYHIKRKTLKTSLIANTPNNEFGPYWMLVPDDQALAKVGDENWDEGDGEKNQLFVEMDSVKNYEDEENKFSLVFDDLHVDVLRKINTHLNSPPDYLNFRATSKSCREVGSAKEWRNQRGSESDYSSSPWLIFPNSKHVGKCVYSMVDPILRNKYYVTTPETLDENSIICYSENGWLLMSSPYLVYDSIESSNLRFYNPLTKSVVCLPGIHCNAAHHFFNFTPDSLECVIVAMSVDHYLDFFIASRNKSSKDESDQWKWEEVEMGREYEVDKFFVRQSNVNAVIIGEIFYFLVGDGDIAYLSQEDYHLRIHTLEEPCGKSSYEQYFLAKCDEDLLSIYIGKEWKWLRAFKFNESDMVWNEVEELKSNNLYLSNVSSIASEAQSPQVGNRIYFSRFYQESIVYYSFNTQKFHLSDGKDSIMSDYYGSEEQMYSCWFEPTWKWEE